MFNIKQILLYLLFSILYCNILISNNIISRLYIKKINLLLVCPIIGDHGPATLARSYINTIKSFSKNKLLSNYFNFTIKNYVTFQFCIEYTKKINNLIWFIFPNYFKELISDRYTSVFKNIIYGPMVSPKKWFSFPMANTYEVNWSSFINRMFSYVVQSERVKNHLLIHSAKLKNIEKKYIVSHGCLALSNKSKAYNSWQKRNIDILIYAKFADVNKEIELQHLIKILNVKYKLLLIRYGNHSRLSLLQDVSNSKILIYYSFYDCWPSSLMEMQNIGIYPIVQQCEFIETYGNCIEDFSKNENDIIDTVGIILSHTYNTHDISYSYRKRNNCLNVLKSTFHEIYFRKNNIKLI